MFGILKSVSVLNVKLIISASVSKISSSTIVC